MFMLRTSQKSPLWSYFKSNSLRISSTEMSSVLHCNPRLSKKKLFLQKTKKILKPDSSGLLPIQHGVYYEPVAREKLFDRVKHRFRLFLPGCILDPSSPLCCSPDGVFVDRVNGDIMGLELKCPFLSKNFPSSKEDIKTAYLIQCFVCLHVSRADCWLLAFYDSESDRVSCYEISPDLGLWQSTFLPESFRFATLLADSSSHPPPTKNKEDGKREALIRRRLLELCKPYPLW
jgi:hypothetical protein